MKDIRIFKEHVIRYAIVVAAGLGLVSIPFLGINMNYFGGLGIGVATALLNFNILIYILRKALIRGSITAIYYALVCFLARMMIYGIMFFIALKISKISAIACLVGYLTIQVGILITSFTNPKETRIKDDKHS